MQEVGEDVENRGCTTAHHDWWTCFGLDRNRFLYRCRRVSACWLVCAAFTLRHTPVANSRSPNSPPLEKTVRATRHKHTHTHAYTNNCLRHICYHLSMSSACLVSSRLDKTFYRTAILMIDFLCKNLKKRIQPHGYRAPPSAVPLGRGEPRDHR